MIRRQTVFPTREEVFAREAGKGVDRGECRRCPGRGSLAIQFQFPHNLSVPHPLSPRHWLLFSSRDVPAATRPMPVHSSSPHVSSLEGPLPLDASLRSAHHAAARSNSIFSVPCATVFCLRLHPWSPNASVCPPEAFSYHPIPNDFICCCSFAWHPP